MRSTLGFGFLTTALFACTPAVETSGSLELRVGTAEAEARNFETSTSLAEYVEIPGAGNELRLLFASYAVNCDVFEAPPDGEVSVSIVITTPMGVTPTSGAYPWFGHEAHGGDVRTPAKAYSYPTTRVGSKSYTFQPGGSVVLNGLTLSKHGSVAGLLNYEFSGDAHYPATSLKGRFSARVCRYSAGESS